MSAVAQGERGVPHVRSRAVGARARDAAARCCSSPRPPRSCSTAPPALSPLIPKSPAIAGWLAGIGERLGYRVFLIALLVSVGAYAGLIALAAPRRRAERDLQTLGDRADRARCS